MVFLILCLSKFSLELQEEKFKVVICDNGSSDGSVKIMDWHNELKEGLKERFPINK